MLLLCGRPGYFSDSAIEHLHFLEHLGLDRGNVKKNLVDTRPHFLFEGVVAVHLLNLGLSLVFVKFTSELPLLVLQLGH